MRLCMVTTFYPPWNYGGDGLFVQRLVRRLRAEGHHVDVVHDADWFDHENPATAGERAPEAPTPLGETFVLSSRAGVLSSLLVQQLGRPVLHRGALARILAGEAPRAAGEGGPYDVIHYHNVSLVGGPGVLTLGPDGGRTLKVYTTHEHWLVCPMHVLWRYDQRPCDAPRCLRCQLAARRPPQTWRYAGTLGRALRAVDHVFCPSAYALDNHRRGGIDAPMSVLPHFCEGPEEPAPRPRARSDERPTFLYVGRLETIKGVDDVIEAARRAPELAVHVVGDGADAGRLARRALGLRHVELLGRVPPEKLDALYRGARAVVVPSRAPETFGMIVIEAFAQGVPVIARDFGPFPELLADGGGLLFSGVDGLAAAMRTLAGSPAGAAAQGRAARDRWERLHTPRAHLRAYFGTLARLGEGRLRAPALEEARSLAEAGAA